MAASLQSAVSALAQVRADVEQQTPKLPPAPLASQLIEPFFQHRETKDKISHHDMNQERGTLRRFLEARGDKPVNAYHRGDVTDFLDTMGKLPAVYGRSPKDKETPLPNIIARAEAGNLPRIKEKTAKRHLIAPSQFFRFAVDKRHPSICPGTSCGIAEASHQAPDNRLILRLFPRFVHPVGRVPAMTMRHRRPAARTLRRLASVASAQRARHPNGFASAAAGSGAAAGKPAATAARAAG